MCVFTHVCRCPLRPGISDPLELKLQVGVSSSMQVLGTELGASGKAAHAHNWVAISPALYILFLSEKQVLHNSIQGIIIRHQF